MSAFGFVAPIWFSAGDLYYYHPVPVRLTLTMGILFPIYNDIVEQPGLGFAERPQTCSSLSKPPYEFLLSIPKPFPMPKAISTNISVKCRAISIQVSYNHIYNAGPKLKNLNLKHKLGL